MISLNKVGLLSYLCQVFKLTRWEDSGIDDYSEANLIEKFQEYVNLEKKELQKHKAQKIQTEKETSFLKGTGVRLSIIEAGILVGLTSMFLISWASHA